jgi:hypothetical protein
VGQGRVYHNLTSLIHSPDPQVKPGWKEFGLGHGSDWSGVAEPVDAIGLDEGGPEAGDLQLKVDLPGVATRGEFVSATVTVTNVGSAPRDVTTGWYQDIRKGTRDRHRYRQLRPRVRRPQALDRLRRHLVLRTGDARHHQP